MIIKNFSFLSFGSIASEVISFIRFILTPGYLGPSDSGDLTGQKLKISNGNFFNPRISHGQVPGSLFYFQIHDVPVYIPNSLVVVFNHIAPASTSSY